MEDIFQVIFKLNGDSEGAVKALTEYNSKFVETNANLKKQEDQLRTLMAREAQLIANRAKSHNPTMVVKYNEAIAKTSEQIKKVSKDVEELSKTEKVAAEGAKQFSENLNKAFDATKVNALHNELKKVSAENKNIGATSKDAFGKLRSELRNAKAELAAAFGRGNQAEIQKASEKVGKLKDQMNDLNDTMNAFASGSKFQQIGNLFGDIGRNIINLDLDRANEQSKALLRTTKSITWAEAGQGIKDLGSTLLNVGKSLLLNPLFLLGTAVTLLIANMDSIIERFDLFSTEVERNTRLLNAMNVAMQNANAGIETNIIKLEAHIKKLQEQNAPLKELIGSYKELEKLKLTQVNNEIAQLTLTQENLTKKLNKKAFASHAFGNLFGLSPKERAETENQITEISTKLTELNNRRLSTQIETNDKISADTRKRNDEAKKIRDKNAEDEAKRAADKQAREAAVENEIADRNDRKKAEEKKLAEEAWEQLKQIQDQALLDQLKSKEEAENIEQKFLEDAQNKRINLDIKEYDAKKALLEKEKEERKQAILQQLSDIQTLSNAAIDAANLVVNAKIAEIDKTRSLQEKRVDDARAIAENGNAELLQLEEERLEQLNKQREEFVRKQQALATLELIANTAIAVSKAAAQGGAAAGVTIAAALIALVGGLISARSIAASAFYEGGYTGDGNARDESLAVGRKPYTYHKGEFVFDHRKTSRYKDIFSDIHKGNIDLDEWRRKVNAYEAMKIMNSHQVVNNSADISELRGEMQQIRIAIEGQTTALNFDANGFSAYLKKVRSRNEYINQLARP